MDPRIWQKYTPLRFFKNYTKSMCKIYKNYTLSYIDLIQIRRKRRKNVLWRNYILLLWSGTTLCVSMFSLLLQANDTFT